MKLILIPKNPKSDDEEVHYELEPGSELSKVLDAKNSPLLFGCRTGICGTCLVEVVEGDEQSRKSSGDEKELLEILCDDQSKSYRLACQMTCDQNLKLKVLGK